MPSPPVPRHRDRPLRVGLLVPRRLPRFVRNSDLHQNVDLLRLAELDDRVELHPVPHALGLGAARTVAPYALSRALGLLGARLRPSRPELADPIVGLAWNPRPPAVDVVLGHGLFPLYPPWAARRAPPLVWGPGYALAPEEGLDPTRIQAQRRRLQTRAARASRLFFTTRVSCEAVAQDLSIPPTRIVHLPYFQPRLPPARTWEQPPSSPSDDGLRVLFVGLQARRKNIDGVIAACVRLIAAGHRLTLDLVSDFRDGPADIGHAWIRVHTDLKNEDVLRLMRSSHVYCMPSHRESYGLVFIEALAAGLPVIAPDHPIQRSMLCDSALFADPKSVESIETALKEVMSPPRRAALRDAGRALYRSTYAPDVVARRFVDTLEAAASEGVRLG